MPESLLAPEDDDLIPIQKFAEKIGLSKRTLYRMIDEGEIPEPLNQRGKSYLEPVPSPRAKAEASLWADSKRA